MAAKKWEEWEIDYLVDNVKEMSFADMANYLNRTESSISHMCSKKGLVKRNPPAKVGDKYHRLLIKDIFTIKRNDNTTTMMLCLCECGTEVTVRADSVRTGSSKSCGCYAREVARELGYTKNRTHGNTNHKLYNSWRGMKERCYNPNHKNYDTYGAKGISMCEEWLKDFQVFYDWAMDQGWEEGLTVDRIKNDLNYCPENCRLATQKEQCNNRTNNRMITAFGETKNVQKWFEDERCVVKNWRSLMARFNYGWEPEEALTKPLMNKGA